MTRKSYLALLLAFLPLAGLAREKPNVLFLFTDDQRPDTIHALGNERIQTPNIDKLVNEGLSFTRAYIMGGTSVAVCTPSRACLFSGRTLFNLASQGVWDFAIPARHATLTQVFRENGYTTFATGKNDPGFGKEDHFNRSFSYGENVYYRGGHRGQTRTPLFSVSPDGKRVKREPDGRFNADRFADACVEFLMGRKGVAEPFFAYVSFMTPHDPLKAPGEYMEMYDAEDMKLPANFMPEHPFDAGVHRIRDERLMGRPLTEDALLQRLADYYALITHTDAQVGRILEALENSGHAENTIVVFTSDNGLALGSHGLTGKQNVYEHSVKVPFILRGPGIPGGEKRDQLCYIYDIYPTLCTLAGVETPDTVQYRDLSPVVRSGEADHRDHLYFAFMGLHRAVRDQRYKLIEYSVDGERHTQLFDLKEDPAETKGLAQDAEMHDTLARMRKLLESERERLNDRDSEFEHIQKMSEEFWSTYERHRP